MMLLYRDGDDDEGNTLAAQGGPSIALSVTGTYSNAIGSASVPRLYPIS